MIIVIKTPQGDPVPYATFDWWQANTSGTYFNTTYRFRGTFQANAEGVVEVLTVAPGEYGPKAHKRAGHFHTFISPGKANPDLETLTTQLYVCPDNDSKALNTDFLNYIRAPRPHNMNHSWSINRATHGTPRPFRGFPNLEPSDLDTLHSIRWWEENILLRNGLTVVAGARTEIRLNVKSWFVL